jgi:hypothetical protein
MKNKIKLLSVTASLLGSALLAQANSITVSQVSAVGGGPSTWTYVATFVNSTVNPGDFFTLNDFGPATVITSMPAGWVFSQGLTGPNSLPATDNASVLNATFTWTGAAGTVISPNPATTVGFTFQLESPGSFSPFLSEYTSIDQATSGEGIAGTDSKVIGSITVPLFPQTVPDGGMTLMLLGSAVSGLALLRRKLA